MSIGERISRNFFCSPILPPAARTIDTRILDRPSLPLTGEQVNSSRDGVLLPAAGGVVCCFGSLGVLGALLEGVVGVFASLAGMFAFLRAGLVNFAGTVADETLPFAFFRAGLTSLAGFIAEALLSTVATAGEGSVGARTVSRYGPCCFSTNVT